MRQFVQNLHEQKWQGAEAWLTDCENCNLPALVNFAKGLRREQSAFVASLREVWSNGPVEGQITRLKLLKRQIYGRPGWICCASAFSLRPTQPIIKSDEEPNFWGRL